MPSIAFLISRISHRGGLEKYTEKLAFAFHEAGWKVHILTLGHPISMPFDVISLGTSPKLSLLHQLHFNQRVKKWLKRHTYDVVFGMERTTDQTHYRAGSGVHRAYLHQRSLIEPLSKKISLQCNPLHLVVKRLEKKAFESKRLQRLFTNSEMVRSEILDTFDIESGKVICIRNGVDLDKWSSSHIPHNTTPELLFVGHGFKRKGLHLLLRALPSKVHLTVVGKGEPIRHPQVSYVGPQKNLKPFYEKADALVVPSLYDPCANVTLEALAMGLTVVSSRYNGASELLPPNYVIEDLFSKPCFEKALSQIEPKTAASMKKMRACVSHLDMKQQLEEIVRATTKSLEI